MFCIHSGELGQVYIRNLPVLVILGAKPVYFGRVLDSNSVQNVLILVGYSVRNLLCFGRTVLGTKPVDVGYTRYATCLFGRAPYKACLYWPYTIQKHSGRYPGIAPSLLQSVLEADDRLFFVAGPNKAEHVNGGVLEQRSQNMGP